MKKRVSSTVTKRKVNPRPRKYASASERQAAYRARAPEVCFRAEAKTVETLDRIAETLDQSRADVLLSMTKFALANHDWARFGLTHKPLPFEYGVNPVEKFTPSQLNALRREWSTIKRVDPSSPIYKDLVKYLNGLPQGMLEQLADARPAIPFVSGMALNRVKRKSNPMKTTRAKRKPTPAQLAARERFAEMARSGAFKKAGAAKRKKNPETSNAKRIAMQLDRIAMGEAFYGEALRAAMEMPFLTAADRAVLTRYATGAQKGSDRFRLQDIAIQIRESEGRKTNPTKKTVSQKISQLTREGYPNRQAVAIALNEERAGKVRRNPASTAPFKFVCIAPLEYSGSKYGIDERTPVTLKFAKTEPAASTVYACYQLPASVVKNDDFQNFAYHNKVLYMSIAQLRAVLKGYAK